MGRSSVIHLRARCHQGMNVAALSRASFGHSRWFQEALSIHSSDLYQESSSSQ